MLDFLVVDVQKSWLAFIVRRTHLVALILFWFVKNTQVNSTSRAH